ncbi:MAG: hypothetical protein AAFX85_09235 [Pseudomonadota bacterium]
MNGSSSSPASRPAADQAPAPVPAGQWKLAALAALFLGPVLLAFVMYYGGLGERLAGGDVSEGELVLPTAPMPSLAQLPVMLDGRLQTEEPLRRFWNVVQVTGDGCAEACSKALDDSARARSLLVKYLDRVSRVLLVTGDAVPDLNALQARHPDLVVLDARDLASDAQALERLQWNGTEGVAHVTDPLTNLVLRYPPEQDRMALFHDLKRLLKLSRIG